MKGTLRQGLWLADGMLLTVALIWGSSYAVAKQALLFYRCWVFWRSASA